MRVCVCMYVCDGDGGSRSGDEWFGGYVPVKSCFHLAHGGRSLWGWGGGERVGNGFAPSRIRSAVV